MERVLKIAQQHYGLTHTKTKKIQEFLVLIKTMQPSKQLSQPTTNQGRFFRLTPTRDIAEQSPNQSPVLTQLLENEASLLQDCVDDKLSINASTVVLIAEYCERQGFPGLALAFSTYAQHASFSKCCLFQARCFLKLDLLEAAKEVVNQVIDVQLDETTCQILLKKISDRQEEHVKLIEAVQQYMDIKNPTVRDYVKHARVLRQLRRFTEAQQLLNKLTYLPEASQLLGPIYYQLSMCYQSLRQYDKALTAIQKSLSIAKHKDVIALQATLQKDRPIYQLICQVLDKFGIDNPDPEDVLSSGTKHVLE